MLYDSSDAGASVELQIHTDEMVSCNEVANESINYTREHFPEINVRLESDLPDAYRLRTNRLYLMRTLRELLYNAAKYSKRCTSRLRRSMNYRRVLDLVCP